MSETNTAGYNLSFKHFGLLRKAIMQKQSGMIHFRTIDDYSGVLLINNGKIGCDKEFQQLNKFLASPMMVTEWHAGSVQSETAPALEAMTYAINHLSWNEDQLRIVSLMFSKLPHIHVNLLDVHFDSFLTDISYNLFYQQSLSIEGFTPAYFLLDNDPSNSLLLHRVRVLTFNYILGLMQSKKIASGRIPEQVIKRNQKFGFIGRIVQRIRGI